MKGEKSKEYIWTKKEMLGEEKKAKAKQIAESLRQAGLSYFMARERIENDTSIFGNEKEEMLDLVKKIMS